MKQVMKKIRFNYGKHTRPWSEARSPFMKVLPILSLQSVKFHIRLERGTRTKVWAVTQVVVRTIGALRIAIVAHRRKTHCNEASFEE